MTSSANLLDQDGTSPKGSAPERNDGSATPPDEEERTGLRRRIARAWPLLLLCLGAVASLLWTGLLVWMAIALLRWVLE